MPEQIFHQFVQKYFDLDAFFEIFEMKSDPDYEYQRVRDILSNEK